ncbi:hypothetical protein QGN31_23345 [Mycobacterium sp. 2-64]|uniref:hypothetical protein n=1 Tax=Mycobacterium sp. 2-64 TaxID=3042319 RepID=UPI002DDAA2DC|nr:hypothetical protein [Mycobacterium sp. 2-64]WSE51007.1 hypothetical protein QGN31_23345 [Mycobacterium sp. 2-64]
MTTTENPSDAPTDAAEAPEAEAVTPGDGDSEGYTGSKLHQEAAKYRTQRNEFRDALAEAQARIDSLLSREVERIASKNLSNPADIFTLSGKTVADVLDDNGDVNPELVEQLATEILGSRPGLRPNARAVDHTQGLGSRGVPQPSFSGLFRS